MIRPPVPRQAAALLLTLIPLSLGSGCAASAPSRLLDLTHSFDEQTIYWPNNRSFQWEKTDWGVTSEGYWYSAAMFSAAEHGGTHLDAPIHFGQGRLTLDQIPVERLRGPAAVLDLRESCRANPDYELRVDDLRAWEAAHGRIPEGAIVLMLTGWAARWPDAKRYLGTDTPGDARTFHFPGFSREAAELLVTQRAVRGVGIDTASIDPGRSRDFPAHRVFNGADIYALENVAALEQVPARGATIIALPMKIKGGTGGPVRIIALVP
jgi:kynurenine formamidase